MRRAIPHSLWIPALMAAAAALAAKPAVAQNLDVRYDPIGKTVNIDADNADVRLIVQKLMTSASITRYQMDLAIDSRVTISMRNKPFNLALQTVLARAGAEYDNENGVLRIFRVGNRPTPGEGSDGPIPDRFLTRISLQLRDVPIATAMANLSRLSGVNVRASQQVPRDLRVSVIASNEPLWAVLKRIAQASYLRVDITGDNTVTFSPRGIVVARDRDGYIGSARDGGTCDSCRYQLSREWRFCPMCGRRLGRQ